MADTLCRLLTILVPYILSDSNSASVLLSDDLLALHEAEQAQDSGELPSQLLRVDTSLRPNATNTHAIVVFALAEGRHAQAALLHSRHPRWDKAGALTNLCTLYRAQVGQQPSVPSRYFASAVRICTEAVRRERLEALAEDTGMGAESFYNLALLVLHLSTSCARAAASVLLHRALLRQPTLHPPLNELGRLVDEDYSATLSAPTSAGWAKCDGGHILPGAAGGDGLRGALAQLPELVRERVVTREWSWRPPQRADSPSSNASSAASNASVLHIRVFTVVLNGMPYLRHTASELSRLPLALSAARADEAANVRGKKWNYSEVNCSLNDCANLRGRLKNVTNTTQPARLAATPRSIEWEWHIVEGVAAGGANSANPYCKKRGKSTRSVHECVGEAERVGGLSTDGTAEYLDQLIDGALTKAYDAMHFAATAAGGFGQNRHINSSILQGAKIVVHRRNGARVHRAGSTTEVGQDGAHWRDKLEMVNTALRAIAARRGEAAAMLQIDSDELWSADQMLTAWRMLFAPAEGRRNAGTLGPRCLYMPCVYFVGPRLVTVNRETGGWSQRNFEWLRAWRVGGSDSEWAGLHWLEHAPPILLRRDPRTRKWVALTASQCLQREATAHDALAHARDDGRVARGAHGAQLGFTHYSYHDVEQVSFKERYYGVKFDGAVSNWNALIRAANVAERYAQEWRQQAQGANESAAVAVPPFAIFRGGAAASEALAHGASPLPPAGAKLPLKLPLPLTPFFPWAAPTNGETQRSAPLVDRPWRRHALLDVVLQSRPPPLAFPSQAKVANGRQAAGLRAKTPEEWQSAAGAAAQADAQLLRASTFLAYRRAVFAAVLPEVVDNNTDADIAVRLTAAAVEASGAHFRAYDVIVVCAGTHARSVADQTRTAVLAWARRNYRVQILCCNTGTCSHGNTDRTAARVLAISSALRYHRKNSGCTDTYAVNEDTQHRCCADWRQNTQFEPDIMVSLDLAFRVSWDQRNFTLAAYSLLHDSVAARRWDVLCAEKTKSSQWETNYTPEGLPLTCYRGLALYHVQSLRATAPCFFSGRDELCSNNRNHSRKHLQPRIGNLVLPYLE